MEPSVSIHHFVHPQWFEELGGWTKEENIELYVKFAVEAFNRFGKHAKLWSSFNEPTVCTVALHAGPANDQPGSQYHTVCPGTNHQLLFMQLTMYGQPGSGVHGELQMIWCTSETGTRCAHLWSTGSDNPS